MTRTMTTAKLTQGSPCNVKLISASYALASINFQAGVADLPVTSALDSATSDLETLVRTTFAKETRTDWFFIPKNRQLKFAGVTFQGNGQLPFVAGTTLTTLALKKGFVNGQGLTTAPVVSYANTPQDFTGLPQTTGTVGVPALTESPIVLIENSDYFVDYEKGTVLIANQVLENVYIQVTYTAGLAVDTSEADLYTGVPMWLQNAAKTQFVMILDAMAPTLRTNAKVPVNTKVLSDSLARMLDSHVRSFPMITNPMF